MLNIMFQTPVTVRVPQLFRYTDEKYVDAFFSTGALRLGSLHSYRNDTHAERKDEKEGISHLQGIMKKGYLNVNLETYDNAYILCTSSIKSSALLESFTADGAFVISDPYAFADQIARCIPGVQQVLLGECNYNSRLIQYLPHINLKDMDRLTEAEKDQVVRRTLAEAQGIEPYFHKVNKEHRSQSEYRFVFLTDRKANNDIHIVCPSARNYCMKINDLSPLKDSQSTKK